MSLNKKGFVLIETLAVTVFAATIFVFLFKSVVPIMGIYDAKIDQIGNIDAAYNNYHIRQLVYNDECFNKKCDGNEDAIKNLNYTMIRCDDYYYNERDLPNTDDIKLTGSDKRLYSKLNSSDYCNKLLEAIGGREEETSTSYATDHYWIFYVKGNYIDTFLSEGLGKYNSYGKAKVFANKHYSVQGAQFGEETTKLIKDTVRDFKAGKTQNGTQFNEHDSYLIFYYWYINPMYSTEQDASLHPDNENATLIPKYKDAIDILTIKSSNDNLYCFKFQVIPEAKTNFYRNTTENSKAYFFYDDKYTKTKKYLGDSMERCMNEYNGARVTYTGETRTFGTTTVRDGEDIVLGSTTLRDYCTYLREKNRTSFYNQFSRDSQLECEKDMQGRSVYINVASTDSGTNGSTQALQLKDGLEKIYCSDLLKYHNQAYAIYQFPNESTFMDNCKHYFKSYDSIKVASGEKSREGVLDTIKFTSDAVIENFCKNRFNHYNLGTIWDDFINARIGSRGFQYTNLDKTELAIVDYDSNCSKDVIIPESAYNNMKITVIGAHAFDNKGIRSVKYSNNIQVIDAGAFDNNYYKFDYDHYPSDLPSGVTVVKYDGR